MAKNQKTKLNSTWGILRYCSEAYWQGHGNAIVAVFSKKTTAEAWYKKLPVAKYCEFYDIIELPGVGYIDTEEFGRRTSV